MKGEVVLTALALFALIWLSSIAISEEIEIELPASNNTTNGAANASINSVSQVIPIPGNETESASEGPSAVSTSGLPDFSLIELSQTAPADLRVPINITCNSTKEVWNSPTDIPVLVFAAVTNKGNNNMSIYTRSLDPVLNTRSQPMLAGTAKSGEDGIIVLGKFVAIEIACDCLQLSNVSPQLSNASPQGWCIGDLQTINAFPK